MKKLLILIMVLAFNQSNAQKFTIPTIDMGLGIHNNSFAVAMDAKFDNSTYGLLIVAGNGGIGKNYTATMSPNRHPEDVYGYTKSSTIIAGRFGYKLFKNFDVIGTLGINSISKHQNRYDDYEILNTNGKYYITVDNYGVPYVNFSIKGKLIESLSLSVGFGTNGFSGLLFYKLPI